MAFSDQLSPLWRNLYLYDPTRVDTWTSFRPVVYESTIEHSVGSHRKGDKYVYHNFTNICDKTGQSFDDYYYPSAE